MIVLVPVRLPNEGDALNIWMGLRCHLYPAWDLIHTKYYDSFSIKLKSRRKRHLSFGYKNLLLLSNECKDITYKYSFT